jgi:hypothetical protein
MEDFIINRGGTNKFAIKFVTSNGYLLKIDVNISLLDNITSYLFIDALDFFRLWYTHNHTSQKVSYITHPHMWDMVKSWAKEKGESKDVIVNFVKKKFKVFSNVQEVLVPL